MIGRGREIGIEMVTQTEVGQTMADHLQLTGEESHLEREWLSRPSTRARASGTEAQ